jgi:peptide/nickel transport system permease protein
MSVVPIDINITENKPRVSELQRFCRVFLSRKLVLFGLIIILLYIFMAIFAPLLAPYDPYEPDLNHFLATPSSAHWLGTDPLGRDVLSRIIFGTRTTLVIGLVVVGVAAFIGMTLGLIAGYFGGLVQNIIMRIIDAFMAFPMIILTMALASLLGGGMVNIIIALSVGMLPVYCRLMYGQVLSVKNNDYVLAEHAMGAKSSRIMLRHLVPNCLPPLIVLITMMLGSVVLAEAGLSFLGIGIKPPTPTWGSMVNDGREYLISNPVLCFAPGIAIMLMVFAFNMIGDGLRDALDPRLRGLI